MYELFTNYVFSKHTQNLMINISGYLFIFFLSFRIPKNFVRWRQTQEMTNFIAIDIAHTQATRTNHDSHKNTLMTNIYGFLQYG